MAQLSLKHAKKVFFKNTDHEVNALNDVSFDVEEGEFIIILGSSGAGKSTLLNMLGGMDSLSEGTFFVDDFDVSRANKKQLEIYRREKVGFVFQFYNLMLNLNALENVQIAASLVKNPFSSEEILKAVGLKHRLHSFPSELSGGEQQRVAIARAVVKNPTMLLCDEPTGALDSKTGAMIVKLLLEISQKYHKTVIVVTHNDKIADVAKRVIRLQDGKIIEDKINKNPLNPDDIEW